MKKKLNIVYLSCEECSNCKSYTEVYEQIISGEVDRILSRVLQHFGEKLSIPYEDINNFKKDLLLASYGIINDESSKKLTKTLDIIEKNNKIFKNLDKNVLGTFVDNYKKRRDFNLRYFLNSLKNGELDSILEKSDIKEKIFEVTYEAIKDKLKKIFEELNVEINEDELEDIYTELFLFKKLEEEAKKFLEEFKKGILEKNDDEKISFLQNYDFLLSFTDRTKITKEVFKLFDSFSDYKKLYNFLKEKKIFLSKIFTFNDEEKEKISKKIQRELENYPKKNYGDLEYLENNLEYLIIIDELFDFLIIGERGNKYNIKELEKLLFEKNLIKKVDRTNILNILLNLFPEKELNKYE